eukprot:g6704.t1
MYGQRGLDSGTLRGETSYFSSQSARSYVVNQGKKKAVLVGCNYPDDTEGNLCGCIQDAKSIRNFLCSKFGFSYNNIRLLVDDGTGFARPTRQNILNAMRWLVSGAQSGDSLFFHFSGHGTQTNDYSGDERDNLNECLVPVDFRCSGYIVDDDINRILVRPIPPGCTLHALTDCCHSGTIMDLLYSIRARTSKDLYWDTDVITKVYKGTSGGTVVQFSGCADDQKGAESQGHLSGGGIATRFFLEAFQIYPVRGPTYRQLLLHMDSRIKDFVKGVISDGNMEGKFGTNFWKRWNPFRGRSIQRPMLSSNKRINIDEPIQL